MKLRIVTMGVAALVAVVLIFGIGPEAGAADRVSFQMDFFIGGKMAPFFVARDKGFFEKNGLEVKILMGAGQPGAPPPWMQSRSISATATFSLRSG